MANSPYLRKYGFEDLGFAEADVAALTELQAFNLSSGGHVAQPIQLPETAYALDLKSRVQSIERQFNHIHQMCLLHATHFEVANKIKTTYILDAYLWAVSRVNPIGIYSGARSLLELHALIREVQRMLNEASSGSAEQWRVRGERYFNAILQARFGTTDPKAKRVLQAMGLGERTVQPVRISKARRALAEQLPWIEPHYALLCDFVHHNMSSQRTAGRYAGESRLARSQSGGALILSDAAHLIHYEFPMAEPGRVAVRSTAARVLQNLKGVVAALKEFRRSPYSEEELLGRTGSAIGVKSVKLSAVGRNEKCPCGSGLKFKKCHGSG